MKRMTMKVAFLAVALSVVSANGLAQDVWSYFYLPDVAFGGGYTSTLIIRDSQGLPSRTVWVYLCKDDGGDLYADVAGQGHVAYWSFQLGPNQEKSFTITSTGTTAAGWVEIDSQGLGDINASLRFTTADTHGNATDVLGVLPVTPNFSWTTSIQKGSATENTGVAVANPWSSSITVNFDLYQNGVRVPGTTTQTKTLNGYGYSALFVDQLFGSTPLNAFNGTGTLRISSATDTFVAMAVRADGTQYSSLPMEANAQQWTCSYTDPTNGATAVTWNWRFVNGYDFTGHEMHGTTAFNNSTVMIRGQLITDINDFFVNWTWWDSATSTRAQVIYQGVIQSDGITVTGNRVLLKQDGTIVTNVPFTATRVY